MSSLNSRMSLDSIVVATKNLVSCALDEESAILNMDNSVYYGMNVVGTRVWNLVQKAQSIRTIRDAIVNEYDVTPEQCERDLLTLLDQMAAEGLIVITNAAAAKISEGS